MRGAVIANLLSFLILVTPGHAEEAPVFIGKWGGPGSADGKFNRLGGITVDREGYLYAADLYACRVQKFSPEGKVILKWGSSGSANGQFITPTDIAVDQIGDVYVADFDNRRIQKFSSNGVFLAKWTVRDSVGPMYPLFVTVGADGNVFATARVLYVQV